MGGWKEKFRKGSPGPGEIVTIGTSNESSPLNRSHPFPSRRNEKRNYGEKKVTGGYEFITESDKLSFL